MIKQNGVSSSECALWLLLCAAPLVVKTVNYGMHGFRYWKNYVFLKDKEYLTKRFIWNFIFIHELKSLVNVLNLKTSTIFQLLQHGAV